MHDRSISPQLDDDARKLEDSGAHGEERNLDRRGVHEETPDGDAEVLEKVLEEEEATDFHDDGEEGKGGTDVGGVRFSRGGKGDAARGGDDEREGVPPELFPPNGDARDGDEDGGDAVHHGEEGGGEILERLFLGVELRGVTHGEGKAVAQDLGDAELRAVALLLNVGDNRESRRAAQRVVHRQEGELTVEAAKEQQIVEQTLRGGEETVQEEVEEDDAHGGVGLGRHAEPGSRLLPLSLPDARSWPSPPAPPKRNVGDLASTSLTTNWSIGILGRRRRRARRASSSQIHCGARLCVFFTSLKLLITV